MIIEKPNQLGKKTKERIEKMQTAFQDKPKMKVFLNTEGYRGIVAQVGIPCSAVCEHHELAFDGTVSIAYVAGEYLLGLSKLARCAEWFMNPTRKTLQERITVQIINFLEEELRPKGLMVVIKARHKCISDRGVKKPSLTITSEVRGIFETDIALRQEFLSLVNCN